MGNVREKRERVREIGKRKSEALTLHFMLFVISNNTISYTICLAIYSFIKEGKNQ